MKILYDGPEAARFEVPEAGWISADGFWYGNGAGAEHQARYSGCTHRNCSGCGAVIAKATWCRACSAAKDEAAWRAMPEEPWSGEPLCIDGDDRFFFDEDELRDWMADEGLTVDELRLVHCRKGIAPTFDIAELEDMLVEDLYEGFPGFAEPVRVAAAALNEALQEHWPDVWFPRDARPALADLERLLGGSE